MSDVTPYKWKNRVKESNNFLYEIQYDDYEYPSLNTIDNTPDISGGCSAAHVGNFFGRNLDLGFNEDVSFVIRCSKSNCLRSIGMAIKPGLTRTIVKGGEVVDDYSVLPFYTMDGINQNGLVISTHVVPKVDGLTKAANGRTVGSKREIKSLWFPRYVLDNCSTVAEVRSELNNLVLTMETATAGDYNHHFLIADKNNNTICVEFHNPNSDGVGEIYVHDVSSHPWLTNFHITRADNYTKIGLKSDKTLPTPFTEIENPSDIPSNYGVEPICNGLERWNTLAKQCIEPNGNIKTFYNEETMINVMRSVYYSNAYKSYSPTEERWCSEFLGADLGVPSVDVPQSDERWKTVLNAAYQAWTTKKRDNSVWHTVYSSVYDIEKQSLRLTIQEGSESYHSYQPYEESFDLYKKYPNQPTVAYRNDFVFDKDLYVLGNLFLGSSYRLSEPLYRKNPGDSNGQEMIQPPLSYQQKLCADPLNPGQYLPVKISMAQVYIAHNNPSEQWDGYGYNIWMVAAKSDTPFGSWKDCQYIQTSRNSIKVEKQTYGDDFLYQFWFDDFDFYQPADGYLRFAFWSAKWNKRDVEVNLRRPDWNSNDLTNLVGGRWGDQVVRLRRAVYCVDDQGHEDDQRMLDEGGCFWVSNGTRITPIQQEGVPYIGVQTKMNITTGFTNVNESMRLIQNQIDVFNSMKDDLQIIVQAARDKKPWPPEL